ncbi:MAG: hypothetical protein H0V70_01695 [Ktedonobacteraceae bacterium]|nr:hypothetical protein [Ktedonobacteraceae bacterium]
MENDVKNALESDTQQMDEQNEQEMTWEEIFDGVPRAPGTETAQERHKQLRAQGNMTQEEEEELNVLFYTIYPQFCPEACEKRQSGKEHLKQTSLRGTEMSDRQCEITLTLLLLEVFWYWITLLHCGITFHGFVGCLFVVCWCLLINHVANRKDSL